jgi:uncharacterized protein (DUF736 family)|tara:strand:+ start:278 stop:532 length:255 start_codon:yes stop_codon:yes gene_type:complete
LKYIQTGAKIIFLTKSGATMPYEIKDDTFTIFDNDNKTKDTQPDYTGQGKVGGREVKIAGWKKVGQSGKEYVSFKVEDKNNFPV